MPISQPLINGSFDIWQRGTSIALTTSAYTADRWQGYRASAGSTVTRQATSDTTNLPFIQYCARVQRNSGNTGTDGIAICQSVESANAIPYAGRTVTISFYARAGANFSGASSIMRFRLLSSTVTDQNILLNGGTPVIDTNVTLTTTWQRFTYTGTIGATAVSFGSVFDYNPVGTAGAADFFEVTGTQIDFGSTALAFRRSGGTIQGELSACQRYYFRLTAGSSYGASPFGFGCAGSTTSLSAIVQHPVTLRSQATVIDFSTIGSWQGGGITAISAATINQSGSDSTIIACTTTGLTAGQAYGVLANGSAAAYIGLGAEL
jgi:hypothetical protein